MSRSEQLERRADLLVRVPGQLVPLGLVDDELGVVAAEVGLQHDGNGRAHVLLDDAGTLADSAVLAAMASADLGDLDVAVLAAGTAGELSGAFRGPVADLRRGRSGLLLCPGPGDADLLGIRLPRTPVPARPGSGWLVTAGAAERVQVARHRDPLPLTGTGTGRGAEAA